MHILIFKLTGKISVSNIGGSPGDYLLKQRTDSETSSENKAGTTSLYKKKKINKERKKLSYSI